MRTRLIAGTITIVCALTAALLLVYVRGGNTPATAEEVVQRARVAASQLASSIGPNTTIHEIVIEHNNHLIPTSAFAVPADIKTETWMAFDANGKLSSLYAATTDLAGQHVYSIQTFAPPSTLTSTDLATGKTITSPHYALTAAGFAASLNGAIDKAVASILPGSAAQTARDATGNMAYILTTASNRDYIDMKSYRGVQSDELATDGTVNKTSLYPVLEVLTGNAVPKVSPIPGLTTTPLFPPTATTKSTLAPGASSCCSVQLDMDPATPGVQATRSVSVGQDISVDIVLGDSVGNLGAFDVSLVYDDTRLTPGAAGAGGLAGNPDFNESALGGTWNCGLGGSPSADTDPATGPGHGVALLSCFTTAAGSDIAAATVIATLRLHVAASGTSSITVGNAHFAHYDTTDIGTCDATGGGTMTCAGGSVTAP